MKYAEVSVNSPVAQRQTFSYAIPPGLNVSIGQAVYVPFGEKTAQGIVLELTDLPSVEQTRDITGIIDPQPLLTADRILLAKWLSNYYLSPLFDAVAMMLPPGFERRILTFISPSQHSTDIAPLNEHQNKLLELTREKGRLSLREAEKLLGKKRASATVSQLIKLNLITRSYELERIRVKPQKLPYLQPIADREKIPGIIEKLAKKAPKQAKLLKLLSDQKDAISLAEARLKTGCDKSTADALAQKGLIHIIYIEVRREPLSHYNTTPSGPLRLTTAQESVFEPIRDSIRRRENKSGVFLLHGVTASGKTEIYLQALSETVKLGKRGIALVPEIALTPQTIERFSARFPGRIAILHSQLSLGEQFDEWQRIKNGEVDVVVGPRSALFAPQPDLGLIIIDEEHEWTYKQREQSPRYHARDAAIKLAELTSAVVVLGSATPSTETCYHALQGDYHLLQLQERVVPIENAPLPQVTVVDMREELKDGNRSIFSRALSQAIESILSKKEQAILFLNRRGGATAIQCRNCGFVLKCKRCDVPLTYHSDSGSLICHRCNYKTTVPQTCPRCLSRRIRYLGIGTEKLEEEVKESFPQARLLRWDSDVTQKRLSHEAILNRFRSHEADILIGTQMVAKGLDIPLVTLVGVVIADTSLNLPDFRAGERTFQLLSQVAGRAGRGLSGGQVFIQTYNPGHYAVQTAAKHDYVAFYKQEIEFRRQLREPPFTQLACLTYTHKNDNRCREEAEKTAKRIMALKESRGASGMSLVGPAPAFIHRLRGRYRWQIILRGSDLSSFLAGCPFPQGWTIDIDPVGL
ncbi:MAG: primosomal protein N' [Dehalococcoidales bacterium]|nr:primosomal protein N' [Dehalococcoidales bacterium]